MLELIDKPFPATRYQGSKAKIADWIMDSVKPLDFNSILDAFGGTGVVSYKMKQLGKNVVYNDILKFNQIIAMALIENQGTLLDVEEAYAILNDPVHNYPTFISDNFSGIFYLDEENLWLDQMVYKIRRMEDKYKQAIAWFALFQSCIIKRPYNLFHRANLSMRTKNVKRSFGNKTTWDTRFEKYFIHFVQEANYSVFNSNTLVKALNMDALQVNPELLGIDAVYIDTPYISSKGVGTDYCDFYHFLEGMVNYDHWGKLILGKYKHKPIQGKGDKTWTDKNLIYDSFDHLFEHYKNQLLIISYRGDGIPSIEELKDLLSKYKQNIYEVHTTSYKYVLSTRESAEVLIVAR